MGNVICSLPAQKSLVLTPLSAEDEAAAVSSKYVPLKAESIDGGARARRLLRKRTGPVNCVERARAAIIGGFVADAASMPLHLVYDQGLLDSLLERGGGAAVHMDCGSVCSSSTKTRSSQQSQPSSVHSRSSSGRGSPSADFPAAAAPAAPSSSSAKQTASRHQRMDAAFFPHPQSPLYSYALGRQSPYGDEAHVFLRMISTRGFFDVGECAEEAYRFLGAYMEKGGGRTAGALRAFVERRAQGLAWAECAHAADMQFLSVARVPALVARYAGSPHLLQKVEDAARMYQAHEMAVAASLLFARLLERVVLGASVEEALVWAASADVDLPPLQRAFLQVLGAPSVDEASAYVDDDDDDDDDEAVHTLVTNGDCGVIYASDAVDAGESIAKGAVLAVQAVLSNAEDDSVPQMPRPNPPLPPPPPLLPPSPVGMPVAMVETAACGNGARAGLVPFSVAAEAFGLSAQLPGSMHAALYALVCFPSYKSAVRGNIAAGGDSCVRSWVVGSLLAAEQGVDAIPFEWMEKTLLYGQVEVMASRLAGSNPAFESLYEQNGCGVFLA